MPLPVINDVYRVSLEWQESSIGGTAVNVLHFLDVAGTGNAGTIYADIDANVTAAMWSWVSSTAKVQQVTITPLFDNLASQTFVTGGPAKWTGGSGSSTPLPQVAGIIKLTTNVRGRSGRGRIYLPFVAENEMTGGTLNDTPAVDTAWDNFYAAANAAGSKLVVASYTNEVYNELNGLTAENKAATQRRRMSRLR